MEPLDNQLTINKLIILYTVQQKQSIPSLELYDYVLFQGFMDYFSLQQYLQELEDSGLLHHDESAFTLTDAGQDLIDAFRTRIPHSVRERIKEYANNSDLGRSSLLDVTTDIQKTSSGKYEVRCLVRDYDKTLFRLTLTAEDESEAYLIRNNWQRKGMAMYRNFLIDLKS